MKDQIIEMAADASVAAVSSKVTWAGALWGIGSWLASAEGAAIVGLSLALAGFAVTAISKLAERRVRNQQQRMLEAQEARNAAREAREIELYEIQKQRLLAGLPSGLPGAPRPAPDPLPLDDTQEAGP